MNIGFPSVADLDLVYRLVKEWADRYFSVNPLTYRRLLDASETYKNDIYMEVDNKKKVFGDPIQLIGFSKPDTETHPLKKFGSEKVRNLSVFVSVPHLIEASLASQDPTTKRVILIGAPGDRFEYSGDTYEVLEYRRDTNWANTDIPVTFLIRAELYRPDADLYTDE